MTDNYRGSDKDRAARRAWYARNRLRLLEEKRTQRRENGDHMRARDRAWGSQNATRVKHGITRDELERLFFAQGGRCAICDSVAPIRGTGCLHIDHDHTTGERRGLLCFNCNRALDVMERAGPTWALRALTYLSDPPLRRIRRSSDGQAMSHVGGKGTTE